MFARLAILSVLVGGIAQAQLAPQDQKSASPALSQIQTRQMAARMGELTSRPSDFTALRLDAQGTPVARMDLFFGSALPENEAGILRLVDSFTFGDETARKDGADGWSTILVSNPEPTVQEPNLVHFEPDNDLAIEIRDITEEISISCTMTFIINYNSTGSTGARFWWYTYSDSITVTTGPNRNTNTDPDAFLYYWNGSAYTLFASSSSGSYLDTVSGYSSVCSSFYWAVQVYMYNGGSFGVRALTVSAS